MQINPPVLIVCSDDGIPMYNTEVYLQVKYPIENIYEAIEKWYLSKVTIPNGDATLDVYSNEDDDSWNIFVQDDEWIEENLLLNNYEAIERIKTFLSTKLL